MTSSIKTSPSRRAELHQDPTERVLHRPSTAATLHLAAATAKGARLFAAHDRAYAAHLLRVARRAWDAAQRHPHLLAPDDHARHGGGPYSDADPSDDAYLAVAQLWLITREPAYQAAVTVSPWHRDDVLAPRCGLRGWVGFMFQRFHLLAALTVLDNVLAPALPRRTKAWGGRQDRARELIAAAGQEGREKTLATRLSGGQ